MLPGKPRHADDLPGLRSIKSIFGLIKAKDFINEEEDNLNDIENKKKENEDEKEQKKKNIQNVELFETKTYTPVTPESFEEWYNKFYGSKKKTKEELEQQTRLSGREYFMNLKSLKDEENEDEIETEEVTESKNTEEPLIYDEDAFDENIDDIDFDKVDFDDDDA